MTDNRYNSRIVVGLDIGTTKITTVIGEVSPDGVIDIIGEGTVPSEGLKRGVVVNLERTISSDSQFRLPPPNAWQACGSWMRMLVSQAGT